MKVLFMGIGLMACSHMLFPQGSNTFFKRIAFGQNADAGASILLADDGYIVYGGGTEFNTPVIGAIKIAKIDFDGNVVWTKTYGKPFFNWYQGSWGALVKTYDKNYVFGGSAHDTINNSSVLIGKFDENGDTLWTRNYSHPAYVTILDAVQAPDSGFAFVGFKTMPNGNYDYYLLRTDQDGHFLWDKTYGASKDDIGIGIDLTPEGGFILSGGTDNYGNGITDGWNVKVEPTSGQIQWTKTYGTIRDDCGTFTKHVGGYFYITKHCVDTVINPGDFDKWSWYLSKLNPNGDIIWQTFFNSPEVLEVYNVSKLPNSGYLLMGYINATLFSNSRAWFAKVSEQGEKCWEREYRFEESESYFVTDVAFTPDNHFIFTGMASALPGSVGSDFLILQLDSMGCFTPGCDTLNVSIETLIPSHEGLRVWPNPVRDNLHIEYCPDSFIQQPTVILYNLDGKMLFQKELPPTNRCLEAELALPDLPKGIYHLAIYDKDQLLAREKVMVR